MYMYMKIQSNYIAFKSKLLEGYLNDLLTYQFKMRN